MMGGALSEIKSGFSLKFPVVFVSSADNAVEADYCVEH